MEFKTGLSRWSMVGLLLVSWPARGEDEKVKAGPALWETSKQYLKDPFSWPSVWRTTPQAEGYSNWREGSHPAPEGGARPELETPPVKAKPDWRDSEEKRTRLYLQKIRRLQPQDVALPADLALEDKVAAPGAAGAPVKYYLAHTLVVSTPFLAEPGAGGRISPWECRIRYTSANESEILQLFDEVTLEAGEKQGLKAGMLYRTYEVGPSYRSYVKGNKLGRLVETNGVVEVIRVGPKTSVARLVRCFGTVSRYTRACPLENFQEVAATGYQPLPDGKLFARVVWVTQGQQLVQPFSYAVLDQGAKKGFKLGDMVLFYNRSRGSMTEKVLGSGLVVSIQERSATILIEDLHPGILNRGDYAVAVQTAFL